MLIDIPFVGGGRPFPDFGPPRPIPMPPSETMPILLKHGFMRFLPDDLMAWGIILSGQLAFLVILVIVVIVAVKRDRASQRA